MIETLREIGIEDELIAMNIQQAAAELHALQRPLAQIDVATAIAAGDVMIGLVAYALAQRMFVHRQVVIAH